MHLSRRGFLVRSVALASASALARSQVPAAGARPTAVIGLAPEPLTLTSAASIDTGTIGVSAKIFDRLFVNTVDGTLRPQLALAAHVSPDGRSITLDLRPGVRWHDGTPFTSADVAYSITEVWKKYHARSSMSYSNLVEVQTPEPLKVVLHLAKPAPYIFSSLADVASQVVPRHLYAGHDVLTNPRNAQPIGTGPFRFVRWERGSHIVLSRNPDYWDPPKPYLDGLIFRFLPEGSTTITALETGSIQYVANLDVPRGDLDRLKHESGIVVEIFGPTYSPVMEGFAFNLDRPVLRDVRVRQAFAHAIDRNFILKNIWNGIGTLADSPVAPQFTDFYSADVPTYPFDLKRAEALLDAAGLPRGADGVRLRLYNDIMPPGTTRTQSAQFIRSSLAKIGVQLELRSQSLGEYLQRVFTRRDFDTLTYGTGTDIDPALGIQRFYWSKTFEPGVPFSNATHYSTPEVDHLLETAQVELDPARRRALYAEIQRVVQQDVPCIPILFPSSVVLRSRRLSDAVTFRWDNFASARLSAS